jgi:hypothetical protein
MRPEHPLQPLPLRRLQQPPNACVIDCLTSALKLFRLLLWVWWLAPPACTRLFVLIGSDPPFSVAHNQGDSRSVVAAACDSGHPTIDQHGS